MKKILFVLLLAILSTKAVYCDGIGGLLDEQMELIEIEEMQSIADRIGLESSDALPKLNIRNIIKSSFGRGTIFNTKEFLKGISRFAASELMVSMSLLGKIVILSVFCAVFQNLHSGFQNESVGKIAYSICYMMIIILAMQSFSIISKTCIDTINLIVTSMQSLLPVLITLLLSIGGITSSSLLQPIVFTSLTVIVTFIKNIVIPMVIFSSILSIISNISDKIRVSKLADLIRTIAIASLGIILTVFTGVITIQGIATSSIDGVMAKTAKFTVDNFIPIIGDFLSEALDTVIGCTMLLKNGVSIVGLIMLVFITILPIIKILIIFLSYKLGAALIQPIIDNGLVQSLNDISNTIFVLLCCMASVGVLFL
ncbi:MAG: stage III sporulation protein AE [Clostridiales bacterium]|nr:stage III sporulation protein AE [Clostridiales bacterium]